MYRWAVLCVVFVATGCGSATGAGAATTDDATTSDLQLADAIDAATDTAGVDAPAQDAPSDVAGAPDAGVDVIADASDVVLDAVAKPCVPVYAGAIPGATLDLSKTTCTFSIGAANGVFPLHYAVHVTGAEKLSLGPDLGGCLPAESAIHGGIATFERISGGASQNWCVCDTGLCAPTKPPFTASIPGTYEVAFNWDGKNWNGPSDTGNQPGPAFPAGEYVFTVTVSGEHQTSDGTVEAVQASASLPITLVP